MSHQKPFECNEYEQLAVEEKRVRIEAQSYLFFIQDSTFMKQLTYFNFASNDYNFLNVYGISEMVLCRGFSALLPFSQQCLPIENAQSSEFFR